MKLKDSFRRILEEAIIKHFTKAIRKEILARLPEEREENNLKYQPEIYSFNEAIQQVKEKLL